jgi:eukaryotic-like serine/threonine-protein kinase
MAIDPKRVKEIFLEAAELEDEAARTAYLDRACGSDAGLRARVEALLLNHDPEGSFLGTPAAVVPDPDHAAPQAFAANANPAVASGTDPAATEALSRARDAVPAGHGSTATGTDEEALTFLTPPQRPDSLGRIGHYEALQILGRGGFGIVFRAFDEMLQRVVALKVMAPQLATTSPARKRFLREARSSAQVRHENVVQVYEVAEQPLPYLAMEFIRGETLQQKLDRVGPLDVPEVLRIGRQIAEGLAAAHAMDLIHRDIKPGNVLLEGGQQKVKITDFGLARTSDDASISQSGIIAGTPIYMAPEQAQGQPLDQRADLFSLGSVLYQMVTGRPPFRANTAVAVLNRVAEDKPRAIREIIPETPQWLCDIIAKLHAKNPDDRYQSAREVADVLADCEAQLKANAKLKDYSPIPRSKPRRSGRRKWLATAAAVMLPVIALVVTELVGVTHLFLGQQVTSHTEKSGSDPQVKARAGWSGWRADAPTPVIAPFTDAAKQVEEVRKELMRRNPGFDGKVEHKIEDGVVTEFRIVTDQVTDLAPIRVFNALRVLECRGGWTNKPNGLLADLTPLEGMNLAALRHLNLVNTKVTDAGMVYFKDCKDLRCLDLSHTKVTDKGLAPFKDCKNLTELYVVDTQLSDVGLVHFRDCKALTHVNLAGTKVSGVGLAHFKDCKKLTHLHLDRTQVGDAGLAHFKDCNNLTSLNLNHTRVSDAGLIHFKDCRDLTNLYLHWTKVSDAGLAHLKGMPLMVLWIDHTDITDLNSLQGMPLEAIRLTPKKITQGLDILRDMKSLKTIGIEWNQAWPAVDFWERYDKGEFKE